MLQHLYAYAIFIATGALFGLLFGIRRLFSIVRHGEIPRRAGKKPISLRTDPLTYWGLVLWWSFGAIVTAWGISVIVLGLIRH
jgi:hypothetical protein